MSNNLAFDFNVNKEDKIITIKREFAAELPLVWDAYTKSEILDKWWGPKPWRADTKSMDFREGGTWLYAMRGPEGEEHWAMAKYVTIVPQKKFSCIDAFSDADGNINTSMPQSKWDVTFNRKGENTLVDILISFDDLAQLEGMVQMGFKEGMTIAMEGLDSVLEGLRMKG